MGRLWNSLRWDERPADGAAPGYVRRPALLRAGNGLTLLRGGGDAFPQMLAAIAQAQHEVLLGTYIVRADRTGEAFRAALVERARAGLSVRVIYDALGCMGTAPDGWFAPLREAGAGVLEFHPLAPWRRHWGFNRRYHQKILVVDGRVGFTGGLNLANEYAPAPQGGGWVDLHARVEGPAAAELAAVFARAWRSGGGLEFEPARPAAGGTRAGGFAIQTIDNLGLRRRYRMLAAWRHAIAAARGSILIANAYFLPDLRLRSALRAAVRRGVSVRVLLPQNSDVPIVQLAAHHLYRSLLRAGVRIWELPGPMLHAKAASIDRHWTTLGSYNLDRRSFLHNLEVGLVVADDRFGGELESAILDELERAREITLADVLERGPFERLLNWLAYRLRYWL